MTSQENYKLFNASSEDMSSVADESVDIIIGSYPYNINTPYSSDKESDYKPFEVYKEMMDKILRECSRVLKPNGIFLGEAADTVYSRGKLIALSGLLQKLCIENGLTIKQRHINYLQSDNGVEGLDIEHHWSSDYYSTEDSHSNCHQWIVFTKDPGSKFEFDKGEILYMNYPASEEGHPCPFSFEIISKMLSIVEFSKGMTVLEPFMGTGRLGREVVKRGGKYIGYEIEKKHFDTAQAKISGLV